MQLKCNVNITEWCGVCSNVYACSCVYIYRLRGGMG